MARILYGLMGDSRGHLNRALILARELPHHEFLFVGGQKALEIRGHGYNLEEIPLIETYYRNNSVDVAATVWNGMSAASSSAASTTLMRRFGIVRSVLDVCAMKPPSPRREHAPTPRSNSSFPLYPTGQTDDNQCRIAHRGPGGNRRGLESRPVSNSSTSTCRPRRHAHPDSPRPYPR